MRETIDEGMRQLAEAANEILSEEEKAILGITPPDHSALEKRVMETAYDLSEAIMDTGSAMVTPLVKMQDRKELYPWQGKESDGEIAFRFESMYDAQGMYDFIVNTGMLEPGEIKITMEANQCSVHFMPHVLVTKPDVIQAAMVAFEDQVNDDEESIEAYEDLYDDIEMVLDERTRISGAPKKKAGKGNPFHNNRTGKFTGAADMKGSGGGSFSQGKVKLKFSKDKKNKQGDTVVHFAATKIPCGRAARKKGKDVRCWDGKKGEGFRVGRVMRKVARKEHVSDADARLVIEAAERMDANAGWFLEE